MENPRHFKTAKGTELPFLSLKGKPYLAVQHRIVWFREEHPDYTIETEFLEIGPDYSIAKATIRNPEGRIVATAHKHENKKGFQDFHEKSESSAVGRALAFLGYGTAFALELEEGERLADAPVEEPPRQSPPEPVKQELPPGAHNEPFFLNNDSANYMIMVGSLKGKLISQVDDKILYQKFKEAQDLLKAGKFSGAQHVQVQNFIDHAEDFLKLNEEPETEEAPLETPPPPDLPKSPKATAQQIQKLMKRAGELKIKPPELNRILKERFNEEYLTLTQRNYSLIMREFDEVK